GAIEDPENRARISAAYAVLGFIVAPFLYFIMPRMASFSLHPKPASAEMAPAIGQVVVAGIFGFTALFFWLQNLRCRILRLEVQDERLAES
ncbi:MAG: ABC transporter permease, partial [bacterium]|nr:ABC transporter permease [bacterium]